ncbi:MAG: 4-(cytidine 5'-diphospho)-2-C-methyl-D-erythritol kinase [Chitinophagales bacterium]
MPVRARAYAKINLLLAVGPRRPDGYHELLSLMQSIGLHDTLDFSFGRSDPPAGLQLRCSLPDLPRDSRNLVYRAALAFREEYGVAEPLHVTLEKGIPLAAGLAGGSADAAATLHALAALHEVPRDETRLARLAARLGADVTFCLTGGTARAEGAGERLQPLPVRPLFWLAIWKPPFAVSTAEVYARLDEVRPLPQGWVLRDEAEERFAALQEALVHEDLPALGRFLYNDLAGVTEELYPVVRRAREAFLAAGSPGALMSGSGPTVFALAGSEVEAHRLAAAVASFPGDVFITRTVGRGVQLDASVRRAQKETRASGQK